MAKLAATSEAVILVSFIVMNLEKILSEVLWFVLDVCRFLRTTLTGVASCLCRWLRWQQHLRAADAQKS